jgi:fructoselysine-6-P-deglycase FrlB-like protein
MNPYISDILSQPITLRAALDHYSKAALSRIDLAEFDRLILSGMGSSFNAAYPAYVKYTTDLFSRSDLIS